VIGRDVFAIGKGLLAEMAMGGSGFQVRPDFPVVGGAIQGAPPLAYPLPDSFSFIDCGLMGRAVAASRCKYTTG
jgi:hypothetical protein